MQRTLWLIASFVSTSWGCEGSEDFREGAPPTAVSTASADVAGARAEALTLVDHWQIPIVRQLREPAGHAARQLLEAGEIREVDSAVRSAQLLGMEVARGSTIFIGVPTHRSVALEDLGGVPYPRTSVRIVVHTMLRGPDLDDIFVEFWGGSAGGTTARTSSMVELSMDEPRLFTVRTAADGAWVLSGIRDGVLVADAQSRPEIEMPGLTLSLQ